jgi:hypothetical protein
MRGSPETRREQKIEYHGTFDDDASQKQEGGQVAAAPDADL